MPGQHSWTDGSVAPISASSIREFRDEQIYFRLTHLTVLTNGQMLHRSDACQSVQTCHRELTVSDSGDQTGSSRSCDLQYSIIREIRLDRIKRLRGQHERQPRMSIEAGTVGK